MKIAPDLSDEDVDAVADLAVELGLDGIVATKHHDLADGAEHPQSRIEEIGAGGLSGAPVPRVRSRCCGACMAGWATSWF